MIISINWIAVPLVALVFYVLGRLRGKKLARELMEEHANIADAGSPDNPPPWRRGYVSGLRRAARLLGSDVSDGTIASPPAEAKL